MSAASVAGQQVISTAPAFSQRGEGITNNAVAMWVAAYMLIGLLGLFAIGLIFRKHVEI